MKIRQRLSIILMLTVSVVSVVLVTRTGVSGHTSYGDAAAIFGSAFASSIAGFAFSAICGALLFRGGGTPQHVVQVMVMSSIAIQSLSVFALWHSIRWQTLRTFLCGGALGLPIGTLLLYHVPTLTYMRAMGAFLLTYGVYTLCRRPLVVTIGPRIGTAVDAVVGFLGGITGGFAGFPGAFVTIWCSHRGWDKIAQRAVFQPFIFIMQVATIAVLNVSALLTGGRAAPLDLAALAYVPVALSGAYLGIRLFHRLSDRQFARLLSLMLIASGIGLSGLL